MVKTRNFWHILLIVLLALAFAACQSTPEPAAEPAAGEAEEAQPAPEEALKFVYVSPDPLGVNEFLIMGQTGVEQAGEKFGAETQVLESEDPTTRGENVRAAVNEGANIVIVLGFEFNDIIPEVAKQNPDVQFLIVDQCIENPPENVRCAFFREYEATFLIGAVAASLSETNHVGVISALDIPFLHRYTDGFAMGAKHVNPDIEVDIRWVGGDNPFADPARAKEQALAILANGADQIFTATAGGDWGVFEAAKEEGFMTYGVDVNQCPTTPGFIVENTIKRVDVAILDAVDDIMNKTGEQILSYGLAEKGMGLVVTTSEDASNSECVILEHPDVIELVKDIEQKIIDGEITIEDPMFAQ